MGHRRHHNNKGYRQVKTGKTGRLIRYLARKLVRRSGDETMPRP